MTYVTENDYTVIVHEYQQAPSSGPLLVRVYRGGEHIHSAEGGVSLEVGMKEATRAIQEDMESRRAD